MPKRPINVLSIDFDYIMAPCINLYNHMCDGRENPTISWAIIERDLNIDNHLSYDANYLQMIIQLILQGKKNKSTFITITEHQEIINYLKKADNYDISTFNVTNIDFHHDMMYNDDIQSILDFDEYNCTNWMGYLYLKNKISSGEWFKAPTSQLPSPELMGKLFPENIDYNIRPSYELKDLLDKEYDYIFLCESPQWVPYQYQHLFEICKMIGDAQV